MKFDINTPVKKIKRIPVKRNVSNVFRRLKNGKVILTAQASHKLVASI